jgi:hypothetical protein
MCANDRSRGEELRPLLSDFDPIADGLTSQYREHTQGMVCATVHADLFLETLWQRNLLSTIFHCSISNTGLPAIQLAMSRQSRSRSNQI